MRILFFSKNGLAINLARLLEEEGHEVRLYIDQKQSRECFTGIVHKTTNWRKELVWVGKEGLIVFDDSGYGTTQDELRRLGYSVVGGSAEADRLELDREYGQQIFRKYGLQTAPLHDFSSAQAAIRFIERTPSAWVIKRDGGLSKQFYYIGQQDDGSDVIAVLQQNTKLFKKSKGKITLHQRIKGVEFGIARYFNGKEWVGPIELNVEHPRLYPGDLGPVTNEMGTLAWYTADEKNRLYRETLMKMKPYLQKIKFKGDFALNCIVNETGPYILEATPRFGSPIIHLQSALHLSPWGDFLKALADEKPFDLKWRRGYGVTVLLATPPFPYVTSEIGRSSYGLRFSLKNLTEKERKSVAFEEVAQNGRTHSYLIADKYGYVAYVTGVGATIQAAQRDVYSVVRKINIPKMFYRNDIGTGFRKLTRARLKKMKYL